MNRRQFIVGTAAGIALMTIGPGLLRRTPAEAVEPAPIVGTDWVDAFGPDGSAYIRDDDLHSVVRRRPDGTEAWDVGELATSGAGKFNVARGLALSPAGDRIYVADVGNSRVQAFDTDGGFLFEFGSYGEGNGQFVRPTDIAVDTSGQLYISDFLGHNVQVFTADGQFVRKIGSFGTSDALLNGPQALALHPDGTLHVVDTGNSRIQIYSASGVHVGSYGSRGAELGQFLSPRSIAIDGTGRRYIADAVAGYVTVYPAAGTASERFQPDLGFGRAGIPLNLAITPSGLLYITAMFGAPSHVWFLPAVAVDYRS